MNGERANTDLKKLRVAKEHAREWTSEKLSGERVDMRLPYEMDSRSDENYNSCSPTSEPLGPIRPAETHKAKAL